MVFVVALFVRDVCLEIETHVSGSQRVSIVSPYRLLLNAERHGAEKNLSGARAAAALFLPPVGHAVRFRH